MHLPGWTRCIPTVRVVAILLLRSLQSCGKTATARRYAASEVLLDVDINARQAVRIDPRLVLPGRRPLLIDEWQTAPEVWNHIRRAADARSVTGRFIVTGSTRPADDTTRHSGTGRVSRLRMRSMSLFERDVSTGQVPQGDLLA